MLSRLDEIIYPNRCEVLEIVPSQRYIYPIFKNGSSSLTEEAKIQGWRTLLNQQIRKLGRIEVFLREPSVRFISGVNTFIAETLILEPDLDPKTILYFAENYLFLDRHFLPQFQWLIQLARYADPDVVLYLRDIKDLSELTAKKENRQEVSEELTLHLLNNRHIVKYNNLDRALIDNFIDKETTLKEIVTYIQSKQPVLYNEIIKHSQDIVNALPKT